MNRKDAVLDAGILDALKSFGNAVPQVDGPHLRTELAAHEDGRRPAAAAEIQHAHAGPQVQRLGQPL